MSAVWVAGILDCEGLVFLAVCSSVYAAQEVCEARLGASRRWWADEDMPGAWTNGLYLVMPCEVQP